MTSLRFGMMACCILGLCRCCLAFLETVASERAGWCLVLSVVRRASLRQVELVVYFTFFGAAAARHLAPPRSGWDCFCWPPLVG